MLNLLWGVRAYYFTEEWGTDKTILKVNEIAKELGFVEETDMVINLNATPANEHGKTNTLRLTTI